MVWKPFSSTDLNTPNQMTDKLEYGSEGSAYHYDTGSSNLSCGDSLISTWCQKGLSPHGVLSRSNAMGKYSSAFVSRMTFYAGCLESKVDRSPGRSRMHNLSPRSDGTL